MKTVMFMTLLGLLHDTTAVTHSQYFFYTASSEVPNFPEFVVVGMVDGMPIEYYDSNIRRAVPKQDWMNKITEVRADYWEWETEKCLGIHQDFKASIDILKQHSNPAGGVHVYQLMEGCEWDDETGEVNGYHQYGYDGEDFLTLDMKTMEYVACKPQAVVIKNQLSGLNTLIEYYQYYYTQECPAWLKKYVAYGKSSLMRTDLPTVSLLQKSPSSWITCHATGFYPDRAVMFWRKDGEELQEGVNQGEILPNHDGSFQMSADLELPSEDWEKYDCVFKLAGMKEDIVTRLEKREIKTNYVDNTNMIIVAIVTGVLVLILIIAGRGYLMHKQGTVKRPPTPASTSTVEQPMIETTLPEETPAST